MCKLGKPLHVQAGETLIEVVDQPYTAHKDLKVKFLSVAVGLIYMSTCFRKNI